MRTPSSSCDDRSKERPRSANSTARCDRQRPPRRIGYARRCTRKSRLAHEVQSRSSVPSCAVASKRSCDLILTRQFALSHLPKPAPHRRSFFIIEMVDTKVLFLNVYHGPHELFLCLFRPSSDVLQEYFKALFCHGGKCITVCQGNIKHACPLRSFRGPCDTPLRRWRRGW